MQKVTLLTFLLLFSISAFSKNYLVQSAQNMKEILHLIKAGDQILIANGTYTDWHIEINANGTAEKPIIIKPENKGSVVFTGLTRQTLFKLTGSYINIEGLTFKECVLEKNVQLIELKNSSNCRISNCDFTKSITKVQNTSLVMISGNGSHNVITKNNFTSNKDSQDLQVRISKESNPQYTLISQNTFKDKERVSWKNNNGGESIQIGQDPILLGNLISNTTVSANTFIRCNGEGEIISNKSSGNTYINNYFKDNDGELVMRGGHDCKIIGNTFEGGTGGIRINGTGHQIIKNKLNHITTAIRLMYGMAKGKTDTGFYIAASNCIIEHNLIKNASTAILIGDSKNADWTGKFDTNRYPSRVIQDIPPHENIIKNNKTKDVLNKKTNNTLL
jgi:poly(beta-D-mannuronate) lyase